MDQTPLLRGFLLNSLSSDLAEGYQLQPNKNVEDLHLQNKLN